MEVALYGVWGGYVYPFPLLPLPDRNERWRMSLE